MASAVFQQQAAPPLNIPRQAPRQPHGQDPLRSAEKSKNEGRE